MTATGLTATRLPKFVYTLVVRDGVDVRCAGIYLWEIEGGEKYVGKYKKISRPTRHYSRNVARLLAELPYRIGKPDEFRRIHRALGEAARKGPKVTLTILANADWGVELNRFETKMIAELGGHAQRTRVTTGPQGPGNTSYPDQ